MIELYVQENPVYPDMEDHFPTIAKEVMRVAALPAPGYTLGLAPFGRVADKFPFGNNAGAIGHDNLNHCQVGNPQTIDPREGNMPVSLIIGLVRVKGICPCPLL